MLSRLKYSPPPFLYSISYCFLSTKLLFPIRIKPPYTLSLFAMAEYLVRAASPVISLSHHNTTSDEDGNPNRSSSSPPQTPLAPVGGAVVASADGTGLIMNNLIPTPPSTGTSSSRKPRGRPPGSKNKPKPPVVITQESDAAIRPVLLEVASGCDVITSLTAFSLRRHTALSVLSGSGVVTNVTIRLPESPTSNAILQGRFDILSLTGTILLPTSSNAGINSNFSVMMCGPQGQVFGGNVAGPVIAADTVMVVAAVYSAPEVHQLPLALEKEAEGAAESEGDGAKVKAEEGMPQPPAMYGGPMVSVRPEMPMWAQAPASTSGAQY